MGGSRAGPRWCQLVPPAPGCVWIRACSRKPRLAWVLRLGRPVAGSAVARGCSPGAVTLARCSAARGPGTAAGAGGGRRGTAPAAVKRRYGLERHQQGSAWSIGSHRRGARAGRSLRGQILLPGTEWVTFTWPPARPEVGEGGFHVRKAPRGSTSLAVQVAGCRSLRAPAPSPSGGMDDFLGAQNPAKGSLLQDGEVPSSCSSPRQCPEGKLGHQESPRRVREAVHLQGGCHSGCGGCTCWCSGFWADVGAQGAHPWLMTTLARRCSPWSMRTARTGASPAWMRGWRTSSPRGSSARSCSKPGGWLQPPDGSQHPSVAMRWDLVHNLNQDP